MTLNKIKEQLIDDEFVNKIVVLQSDSENIKLGTDSNAFIINNMKDYSIRISKDANETVDSGTSFTDSKSSGMSSKFILNSGSNELIHQEINDMGVITKNAIVYDTYNISVSTTAPSTTLKNGYQHQVYS